MDCALLVANFSRYISLSPEEESLVLDLAVVRNFGRGDFICREGEVNRYTNFITTGSARVYYLDAEGVEHVIQLGIRDWWISDYSSFITQQPGILYCEALERTEVISFSYDHLQHLYDKVPKMERFFRLLIQHAYAAFQNRVLQSLSMDAEQRYIHFRNKYPALDIQLPQKHIASYLGMSAEFLSKVKKRVMLKERAQARKT
jgi:CRP-like cAMP-binding protein